MSDLGLMPVLQQQQSMKMTPQMIQSINLLALPIAELRERIYEEAEKNPALEIEKDFSLEIPSVQAKNKNQSFSDSDTYQAFLESIPERRESLQEHLLFQLSVSRIPEADRSVGKKIIQNLDKYGFHIVPPEMLLAAGETPAQLDRMLRLIHSFDPAGIACVDLRESLLIQARQYENPPPLALVILSDYMYLLEKPRTSLVAKKLAGAAAHDARNSAVLNDLSEKKVSEALNFIRSLDPFPARRFSVSSETAYIIPDVRVRKCTKEETEETGALFTAELIQGIIPKLKLSDSFSAYKNTKNAGHNEAAVSKYVRNAVKDARWFISSVEQRKLTLLKVCRAILAVQASFFEHGPRFLAPLRMKDIADKIGVHEATVSRIANGKYVQCEWGIFEIRYFFSNSVAARNLQSPLFASGSASENSLSESTARSKESIKEELRQIIQQEGSELSDEKLSKILAARGIKIARRTVAKYRLELNISSSFGRRNKS
ncbi:MAG: RNA polymerase factor sigma-54 [Bacteroides sp.]|nr:RNA polymerase factor sigma-54 [Prevotella sp.]MCM1408793.1 RNA polymerase factor sigma-54 [Treponema brennaborense]MCM1470573.1 RNA polymerase factor sigma-54 [Bacteroides sp.]